MTIMASVEVRDFQTSDDAAEALSASVASALRTALSVKSSAYLGLSGGRTPKLFLEKLSLEDLDWEQVAITLVDERCYVDSHPRSNAKLVKEALFQNNATDASFVPLYSENSLDKNAPTNPLLQPFLAEGFDATVLGMGPDGHTASFFPDADCLEALLDPAQPAEIRIVHAESAGEPRLTFNSSALLQSKTLFLQLEGREKADVFSHALEEGPANALPIRVFLQQEKPVLEVFRVKDPT